MNITASNQLSGYLKNDLPRQLVGDEFGRYRRMIVGETGQHHTTKRIPGEVEYTGIAEA
jgi:hypothetical protein